jgi:hypothetical protein
VLVEKLSSSSVFIMLLMVMMSRRFCLKSAPATSDVPFPGQYMMASDGSDFCLRLDVWEAATAAAQAATSGPNGDAQDLAWRQRAGVLLRYTYLRREWDVF